MALVWHKVTWYSKLLALLFFLIVFPILTFCLGRQYQDTMFYLNEVSKINVVEMPKSREPILKKSSFGGTASALPLSGVEGVVTIGPTCPVQSVGDSACDDKPISAHLVILDNGGRKITETVSRKDGTFTLFLYPGEYVISEPPSSKSLPRLSPKEITVVNNKMLAVSVSFDSGIR
jgi:hypothetical protein